MQNWSIEWRNVETRIGNGEFLSAQIPKVIREDGVSISDGGGDISNRVYIYESPRSEVKLTFCLSKKPGRDGMQIVNLGEVFLLSRFGNGKNVLELSYCVNGIISDIVSGLNSIDRFDTRSRKPFINAEKIKFDMSIWPRWSEICSLIPYEHVS